ncbi:MAG: O-antigen ligase [Flavobacterium sp.]|jgi:O-antigen ligase
MIDANVAKPSSSKMINNRTDTIALGAVGVAYTLASFFYGGDSSIFLLFSALTLLTTLFVFYFRFLSGHALGWSKLHTALLIYSLFLFSNIFTSQFSENSIHMAWLFLAMPMTLLICGKLDDTRWRQLLFYLSITCSFSGLWGLSEFFDSGKRASGPLIDPNTWASILNFFYFAVLSFFLLPKHQHLQKTQFSIISFIVLTTLSTAIFAAYSRVGNVNFALAFIFIMFISLFIKQLRTRVLLLCISACFSFSAVQLSSSTIEATGHNEGYILDASSLGWSQRLSQWESGIAQYKDYPVFGSGLGTFRMLYPSYRGIGDVNTAGNYVHNDYIQLLAESGPISLIFIISFLIFLLVNLWTLLKSFFVEKKEEALEPIILIVAMGTVFVHALMNFTLYSLPNQILIGVTLARLLMLTNRVRFIQSDLKMPKLTKFVSALIFVYILLVNSLDFVSFDLVYKGGHILTDRSKPGSDLNIYNIVSNINKVRPNVSGNRFAMATFYRKSFDKQESSNLSARQSLSIVTALEYQRGLELNPYHYQVRMFFAEFLVQNPELMDLPGIYQTPENLYREGLAIAPCYVERYLNLANFLQQQGQADAAYRLLLDQALPWAAMRYDGYKEFRIDLHRQILHGAILRQDAHTMEKLLSLM